MEYSYKECLSRITELIGTEEMIDSSKIEDLALLRCAVMYGIIEAVPQPVLLKLCK